MGDFLDSVSHLTPEQRVALRGQELDNPDAIVAFTPEVIASTAGLTLGAAGRLLRAAQQELDRQATDRKHAIRLAELQSALTLARQDPKPHRLRALQKLGFTHVVQTSGEINPQMTLDMRADIDEGASVPRLWQGERVVSVDSLIEPTVFRHWRTGQTLQAGKDDLTGIPWADLGLDVLRLLVYGQRLDAFHGMTDAAVFEQAKAGKLTALRQRATNEGVDLATMDRVLVHGDTGTSVGSRTPTERVGAHTRLNALLASLFDAGELRRFIHHYYPDIEGSLPGPTASMAQLAFDAVAALHREGCVNSVLRDLLAQERPRRRADILALFQ